MKKILVVDDSALMRRVLCDIINQDERFTVIDEAVNGLVALDKIRENTYDGIVLDVNMPKMDGITLLKELRKQQIPAKILMASTDTSDGAKVTMDALELGALDFIHKPGWAFQCNETDFKTEFLSVLEAVCKAKAPQFNKKTVVTKEVVSSGVSNATDTGKVEQLKGKKIVALACSTGGPKALQSVLPFLPKELDAPVVMVQHMPVGFTLSLAQRMDNLSEVRVVEAEEGQVLENGCVYIARSGQHMNLVKNGKNTVVHYSDEPSREGVKPCANYMYESLMNCDYDSVLCVVLTGMGADGTEGISNLKQKKNTYVVTQDEESCVVYGMPKSIVKKGMSDIAVPLTKVAQEIILRVGVK